MANSDGPGGARSLRRGNLAPAKIPTYPQGRASAPAAPHEFPHRILLAVLGLTPQVLTRTLYALAVAPGPGAAPFVPTAIHVVTTARGRRLARRELLDPATGRFFRLCADYRLDPRAIVFDHRSFVVVERGGRSLEDVTTAADHATVAVTIQQLVRRLTGDEGAAVHASLAGGRRAMGFYLGQAVSLYGRPQDRLSDVRVAPGFAADLHYPPPVPATAAARGRRLNTAEVRIALADVPFFRLRDALPPRVIDELPPPGAERTEPDSPAAALELHLRARRLTAGGETVRLPPADFAFYAVMARRRAHGRDFVNHRTPNFAEEYLREYARVTAASRDHNAVRVFRSLRSGVDHEWFEQRKARVNRILRIALGAWLARPYQIGSRGRRPDTSFGLFVDPAAIAFHY